MVACAPETSGENRKKKRRPPALLLVVLAAAAIAFAFWLRASGERRLARQVNTALQQAPELAIYPLEVDIEGETIRLRGKLPSPELRLRAEEVAEQTLPDRAIDNRIQAVRIPPDPGRVREEVERLAQILNQQPGVAIEATYEGDRAIVWGIVARSEEIENVHRAMKQVPGVASVIATLEVSDIGLEKRVYFAAGSAALSDAEDEKN